MPATSAIRRTHGFTDPLGERVMHSENPEMFDSRMPRLYPVNRHVYIYSVAKRAFPKKHVYFQGKELRGCGPDERYVLCAAIPDPPQQIADDPERGGKRVEVEPRDEAGWRVAIDILNPNNPSIDPYFKMDGKQRAYYATSQGVDLIRFGLFPSVHNPPKEQEILRAEKVRDEGYQELVDEAFSEQASNPQGFRRWLRQHPEITTAMEALGIEADWHRAPEMKQKCPNCGETIKLGVAFHVSNGQDCIIDHERYTKARGFVSEPKPRPQRG